MALSQKQLAAIEALLQHAKQADAARACELHVRTLQRYLRDSEFVSELQRRQDEILHATTAALVGGTEAAIAYLADVVQDGDEKTGDRLRAATFWLEHTKSIWDTKLILQRLEALEATYGNEGKSTEN
jgi:hypothetical protein